MTEQEFLAHLTQEQEIAVKNTEDKVSVSANAGSGKTTLLVSKYLYLQLFKPKEYNYKNVVAITFTKKAASEILKKIHDTIADLLGNSNIPEDKRKYKDINLTDEQVKVLKEISRNLINLKVSTIHSFCRSIIKDYYYKIGLQSNFTVLEEAEQSVILNDIILEVLGESGSKLKNDIIISSQFLGFEQTIELIKTLFYKKNHLENQKGVFSKSIEDISSKVIDDISFFLVKDAESYLDDLYIKIDFFEDFSSETLQKVKSSIEAYRSNKPNLSLDEIIEKITEIRNIKDKKMVSNTVLGSTEGGKFLKAIRRISSINEETTDREKTLFSNRVAVGLALTNLTLEVVRRYEALNLKENRIDNDTSIEYTVKLLQDDTIRGLIQHDLAYLMIDEFQDTDDKQLEIANRINEGGSVKLFVVGDDKQGIYGFRNADIRVFSKLRESISEENQLSLTTSFRSDLEINAFINDLYSPYMKSEISEYDVDFSKIVSSRDTVNDDKPKVNILFYDAKETKEENSEKILADEQLIKAINQIIDSYENKEELKLGDICILSSSGKSLGSISTLLSSLGLENVVLSSRGFYSKNEVKELTAFIKFIDESRNDFYCAAILKSSLFNYSDENLLIISANKDKDQSLWDCFKNYSKKINDDFSKEVIRILDKAISLSGKLPISNILIKVIDDSNWNYYYQGNKRQQVAYRNLYKFMGITRSLENVSYGGMTHLFNLLDYKIERNNDAEDVGEVANAIKLSTIHHAKGMEYKHVIIYDFDIFSTGKGNDNTEVDEDYGCNFKMPASVDRYDYFGKDTTLIDELIKEKVKVKDLAENLRKCYVATTRAEKSLHLIMKKTKKVEEDFKRNFGEIDPETNTITKSTEIDIYNSNTKKTEARSISYTLNIDYTKEPITSYTFDLNHKEQKEDTSEPNKYIEEIDATEKNIRFSATKLSMLDEDTTYGDKFKETYIFGLPNEFSIKNYPAPTDDLEGTSKEADGTQYGILFHSIMENIAVITDETLTINEQSFGEVLKNISDNFELLCNEETKAKLHNDLQAVLQSKFIIENRNTLLSSIKEFELKMAFGDHTLQATYDIYHSENTKATIWDWKTNKFKDDERLEDKSSKYQLQMDLYALLAFKYNPNFEEVRSKLLFINKLKTNSNNSDWMVEKIYTKADIRQIELQIAEKIGTIKERYPNIYRVQEISVQ